jgi:hypothetical protein
MGDKPILFSGPMVRALLEGRKTQDRSLLKPTGGGFGGVPMYPEYANGERIGSTSPPHFIDLAQENGGVPLYLGCTPINPGDRLWVRETFGFGTRPDPFQGCVDGIEYRADEAYLEEHDDLPLHTPEHPDDFCYGDVTATGWRPSIHMPRWASRITLLVTDVRVQRLRDISEDDAVAEGIELDVACCGSPQTLFDADPQTGEPIPVGEECCGRPEIRTDPRETFRALWDSLNANRKDKDGKRLPRAWVDNPWVVALTFEVIAQNIDTVKEQSNG